MTLCKPRRWYPGDVTPRVYGNGNTMSDGVKFNFLYLLGLLMGCVWATGETFGFSFPGPNRLKRLSLESSGFCGILPCLVFP